MKANDREFVLADLPGLIEGAAEGAGLGHRFLGHVERCAVILHLVDGTAEDPVANWKLIRKELKAYGAGLDKKPEIIGLNKIDALSADELKEKMARLKRSAKRPVLALSGVSGEGIDAVVNQLYAVIAEAREAEKAALQIDERVEGRDE